MGCEVASFLAERGAQVTMIEMLPYVAHGIPRLLGKTMKDYMKNLGVHTITHGKVVQIREDGVVFELGGQKSFLPVQGVALAVGALPKSELIKPLKDLFQESYSIGDCLEPRKALEAIYEGAKVGHQL